MTSAGVRAFHPTPEEDHERRTDPRFVKVCGVRPVSPVPLITTDHGHNRYYCTVTRAFPSRGEITSDEETPVAPTGDEQPVGCELAKDTTLNALAQLGVFRFNANRSFVSIIDGETQHIIAEMTGSVSLRGTATNHEMVSILEHGGWT